MRRKKFRKILIILIVAIVSTFIFGFFFVYLPYKNIKAKAMEVMKAAKIAKDSFKENDIDKLKSNIYGVKNKYQDLKKEAEKIYWLIYIPFVGAYVSDLKNGIEGGDNLIEASLVGVETIAPYADLIGFKKGESSFVEKSAD